MIATLEDIEGVGSVYLEKLKAAGITTPASFQEEGVTPKGRGALAEATGISEKLILRWMNHLDLSRIPGIGPQTSELLEASGVDTVPELATRNATNLAVKLKEVNDAKNLMGTTPGETEVTKWIATAKELPRLIHY